MTYSLNVESRDLKSQGDLNSARYEEKKIPVVIYGHGFEPVNGFVNDLKFAKIAQDAGESSLIEVSSGEQEPYNVLIKDVQYDPVSGRIIHADLHRIRMDEEVTAEVKVEFSGEAPAVKELGGNLVLSRDTLTIRCLPKDLIASIQVDLSSLVDYEKTIRVSDLDIPAAVKIMDEPYLTLASVVEPKVEAAPVVAAEAEALAEGETPATPGAEGEKTDEKKSA